MMKCRIFLPLHHQQKNVGVSVVMRGTFSRRCCHVVCHMTDFFRCIIFILVEEGSLFFISIFSRVNSGSVYERCVLCYVRVSVYVCAPYSSVPT